ncbi:TonB-dependent receptor [Sphingobium sp. JS3065]|uniref:TonB-dependent receptor n=1 Tax=Sphingobium sp. JS3065 TaxID=2970925 RepID=UPI002263C7DF|nr:TonB-dependent receptor [Sphingobium sp. JS3065]UZW55992.1 TonB-dependent receptor [Sphingobium sp. JS3065]
MRHNVRIALLASVFSVCWSGSAAAQDQDAGHPATPATTAETDGAIADIMVTARRRDESLSRTPVAVAAVSGDTLAKANIVSEYDLRQATPGLQVRGGVSSNQLYFSLRGQSQDPFSNSRPGVLPYINEVQIGSLAGASTFYDLASVQVLKGPQGTLFGRSATGGALLYATQKPTDEFGGYVSALYGNYDQYKLEGAINAPLSADQVMLRVAGFYRGRDGFQRNLLTGGSEGDQESYGFRPSLSIKLGPNITNELVADYTHIDSENTEAVISGLMPFTGTDAPFIPAQFLYAGTANPIAALTGQCTLQGFAQFPGGCPPVNPMVASFYNAYFANPAHPAGGISQVLAEQNARGPFRVAQDGANFYRSRNTVVTNTTRFDIADDIAIKNIIGYVNIKSKNATDSDGTPYGLSVTGSEAAPQISDIEQFSAEMQLLGKALEGRLEYVFGGFYSYESTYFDQTSTFFDVVFGGVQQRNATKNANRTYAGYAQGTYHLGESGIALTAGGRYTRETAAKHVKPQDSFRVALGDPAPAGFDYDQSRTFENFSWTLGVQYQADPSLLIYANSRRAYKSGGFNAAVAPIVGSAQVGGDSYDAERVTDAELGTKFNGRIGGRPVRASLALFYNWIANSQRAGFALVNNGPAALTVNVPQARTYGAEVDAQVKPLQWLSLGGSFNYTEAEFTNGNVTLLGRPVLYDRVPNTPKYNGSAFADVTVPLGSSNLAFTLHGDVYYQSESFTSPRSANSAGTRMAPYTLANFRVGVEDETAGWSLTANLKNAFNKVYYTGGLQVGEIYQVNTLIPGDPRTYMLELRYKF